MKKLLTSTLLAVASPLVSTTALAHSGHLANESMHGFLHVEHITVLSAIAVIACLVTMWRKK